MLAVWLHTAGDSSRYWDGVLQCRLHAPLNTANIGPAQVKVPHCEYKAYVVQTDKSMAVEFIPSYKRPITQTAQTAQLHQRGDGRLQITTS